MHAMSEMKRMIKPNLQKWDGSGTWKRLLNLEDTNLVLNSFALKPGDPLFFAFQLTDTNVSKSSLDFFFLEISDIAIL